MVLAGDGRCDSPGKTAKFCTYSVMVSDTNHILHFENIDKREVALRSPNMEREGMRRCLDFLLAKGLTVEELITDASSSVAKMLGMMYYAICIVGKFLLIAFYNQNVVFSQLQNHFVNILCTMFVETQYPSVYHSCDVWHKAKLLKKTLSEVHILSHYCIFHSVIAGWENTQHDKDQ